MRCLSCDALLQDGETRRKFIYSKGYMGLCQYCYNQAFVYSRIPEVEVNKEHEVYIEKPVSLVEENEK